jgi:hypothetical protein
MATDLMTPILTGAKHVNFFERRVLTGRDMREEQQAMHRHLWQLGRAAGAGVVEGLEVLVESDGSSGSQPQLQLTPGVAIDQEGHLLEVSEQQILALSRTHPESDAREPVFQTCGGSGSSDVVPNGSGVYLLVMSPASGYTGSVPLVSMESSGAADGCGKRYVVDGVRFRLVRLSVESEIPKTLAERSKLRNKIAHLCLGTERLRQALSDPFRSDGTKAGGVLGREWRYHSADLTTCDVPLASLYWTLGKLQFVDMWSVRRRPAPAPTSDEWPALLGPQRAAVAEAVALQFQEHIEWLRQTSSNPGSIAAGDYFVDLPPAGLLPLVAPSAKGFNVRKFFGSQPQRETFYVESTELLALLRRSRDYLPFRLEDREMIWIYRCVQDTPSTKGSSPQAFIAFAGAHVRPTEPSRFDVARWDRGRFV